MKTLKEIDGKLIHHWYIVALESEIGDKPISRTVYDVPYVLFRDENKKIRVFVDKCIHRGSKISEGQCEDGKLRCPYHGWRFDSQGHVCEVPSEGPNGIPKDWALKSVPHIQQDGCVWIWPGDLELKTERPEWRFPEVGNPRWAQYFMITDFTNEVTHLVQNFMDVPHTVFVHAKWFRRRKLLKVPIKIDVGNARVKVTYDQSQDSIGFMDQILNSKKQPMVHTDEYIFPNLTRVDYSFGDHGFIINSQCTPVSRYQTRVFTWIAYRIGFMTHLLKPFMNYYTRQVIEQDVRIMVNHGKNLETFEKLGEMPIFNKTHGFYSTEADELHLAIDKMRTQGVTDSKTPFEAQYQREREFWI